MIIYAVVREVKNSSGHVYFPHLSLHTTYRQAVLFSKMVRYCGTHVQQWWVDGMKVKQ